jgi:hypothetical protein
MLAVWVILSFFAIFFTLITWASHGHTESHNPDEGEF